MHFSLAVIGDIHGCWSITDAKLLEGLGVDLALFVGDFGNEAVDIVAAIAQLSLPIAVAFGNHDAWYSASSWGRKKCPYDRQREDRVQQQLDLVGSAHVGYGWLGCEALGFAVVGGRPFSWGGPHWQHRQFLRQRFGVESFQQSSDRIVQSALDSSFDQLIFLSHNGPTGLGDRPDDPCGRDWMPLGGDFGDPDLAMAITALKAQGKTIPLVAFGHMHHRLRHRRDRQRTRLCCRDQTLYLNAALSPRIMPSPVGSWHGFTLVEFLDGAIACVDICWLNPLTNQEKKENLYSGMPETNTWEK
ncbi:TIGR04168 family protein [Candidatus Synechococcus calcipolaris G9]|uniref:TIGR04168 family protein n=1 Tax=Candidatus Synechococcus calcipolaris G9 TaxID=1497997 RepID=A0ABT6EZS5_9SYNE|nr:TIGR04168 family protein [Candidatus Synechococcus calcipolaris]MDG2991104.1 TIGR04168 family protein [Candidatus Synechococcus calcipolaris G9]